jgi:uroporphyrinogen III methyltransferase/synthase
MGMANLPNIVKQLLTYGRSADTPVALVRWGTRPEQETLTGTLADIVIKAEEAGFKNPAIIIVGEVVKLRDKLQWFEKKPLFGQRIVVTRSREQASALSARLEELGAEVWEFPTIEIASPVDWTAFDAALDSLNQFQWIIFTSVNGVRAFFERLRNRQMDVRNLYGIKICAIGPKTRECLEKYGLNIEYVPEEYVAEAVVAGLKDKIVKGDKVLLPRADIARKVLADSLKELGAEVTEVIAYRTVKSRFGEQNLTQMLKELQITMVTFTSSSTVKNFVDGIASNQLHELMAGVTVACIGPITAQTAKNSGLTVHVQATEYTIEGLVQSIVDYIQKYK